MLEAWSALDYKSFETIDSMPLLFCYKSLKSSSSILFLADDFLDFSPALWQSLSTLGSRSITADSCIFFSSSDEEDC